MINNFITYLNENNQEYSIGDTVVCVGNVDDFEVNALTGKIIDIKNSIDGSMCSVINAPNFKISKYTGKSYHIKFKNVSNYHQEWWISPYNIKEKMEPKRLFTEEDPYGEEDWND